MNISSIGSISSQSNPTTASSSSNGVAKDEFLRLLVAQLQNQDPLTPQDGTEFVAQLAQFASLEQVAETNERLANLEAAQSANLRAGFTNLVGRTVVARTDTFAIPMKASSLSVDLPSSAREVTVTIVDSNGRAVRTLELGGRELGRTNFDWDGLDDRGTPVSPGTYRMMVSATAADGSPLGASTLVTAPVDSLDFGTGQVQFRAGGASFGASDIIEITASKT